MNNNKIIVRVVSGKNYYINKCRVVLRSGSTVYESYTNEKGIAKFAVPFGIYELKACKDGYKRKCYTISAYELYNYETIKLCKEKSEEVVINLVDKDSNPIIDAEISIVNNIYKYKSITDKCGIAMLNVYYGYYHLTIKAKGYNEILYKVVFRKENSFTRILFKKETPLDGSIFGSVGIEGETDLKDIGVILYKVYENNTEEPIEYTYTDEKGEYIFLNQDSGRYLVKATK
ncbi:MAG: hypothetical protein ACRCVJ_04845 [Clostridium sp.]|uniref:hypothetical protein n=1 Tax=Clostridium sp. TaxID=1506 RepID=UPI003F3C8BD5